MGAPPPIGDFDPVYAKRNSGDPRDILRILTWYEDGSTNTCSPQLCMQNHRTRADTDLLASTRGGDLAAFGEIVARYQQMVCAVAFATCGRRALSEDIAQETFVAAWKNIDKLQDDDKLKAWLCSIARHRAKDALRKRRREVLTQDGTGDSEEFSTTLDDAPSPMESTASLEEEQQLWHALEAIPPNYREPLVLFYRDGQSIQNVADDLGLSVAAVKQRLSRGRTALRDSLARVSSCLARTQPSKAFTLLVMASVSAHAGLASAGTMAQAAPSSGFPAGAMAKPGLLSSAASTIALLVAFLCSGTLVWILLGLSSSTAPKVLQPETLLSASAQSDAKQAVSLDIRSLSEADLRAQVRVQGQVLDLFGRAVPGATVVLNSTPTRTTLSDARGLFAFAGVAVGSYMVQAHNGDGGSRPLALHLDESQDDLVLKIVEGSALELQLVQPSGQALAGIEVMLEAGALELSSTTDKQGVASFEGITTSMCLARIEASGFATSELRVLLGAEAALHKRRLVMQPGLPLAGTVVDAKGKAIAGAKVLLKGAPSSARRDNVISDEHGRWHFDAVASEESLLVATHDDYAWITKPITPKADGQGSEPITLVMPRGKAASGLVVLPDGSAAAFAEVTSHPSGKHTSADAQGRFVLAGLEPGEDHLRANHQIFGSSALSLGDDGKDRNNLLLVLEDHSLRGVVLDARGNPVAGASVRAMRQEREIIEAGDVMQMADDVSNQRGEFTLGPLPGGAGFDLVAIMPGVSPAYLHLAPLNPVVARSGDTGIELRLSPPGQIIGQVHSSQGSVNEFAITIANYAEALDMEASSPFMGTEGSFALNEVPAGEYSIGVVAAGFEPKVLRRVQVKAGGTLDLGTVNLRAGKRVRGRVLNAAGLPVEGARVLIGNSIDADATHLIRLYENADDGADPFAVSNSSSLEVRSDAEGYFELDNLHHNRGALYAAAESPRWGRSQVAKLAKRESGELILHLQAVGSVVGTISNAPKECLISAVATAVGKRTDPSPLLIEVELSGSDFQLHGLAPGSYLLSAHSIESPPDFENGTRVEIKAGQSVELALSVSTRQAAMWTDESLDSYELHVDALCACATESCRADERNSLDEINQSHGVMTNILYRRITQLEERLESCDP